MGIGAYNPAVAPAAADLSHHRGDYGFDAPFVTILLGAGGLALLIFGVLDATVFGSIGLGIVPLVSGIAMLLSAATFVYTTRRGKFVVWAELLPELRLVGAERVLDVGCGRGAVLLMVAQLLPHGKAIGIDLWKAADQSGNTMEATLRNAEREGVRDRVELHTGDVTAMPFEDASFDVVLSSLVVHNIRGVTSRRKAIEEVARVLKPGGQLAIADFRFTSDYARRLHELGLLDVRDGGLDWRFWYGGPWTATKLVTATKPR